ncbi:MAG: 50S ribosomal protein L29 [Candidatus Melainabacteria bacterium]|nr:50S ribosomal protein L29 [Candidatus Melainabacteria bacterium]MBX9673865.1 50S ribosomal protein L29 [Candidatus Obscuribacterales bacterium]
MKVKEMRELSNEDLTARIEETRRTIVDLRFQHALRKLESPAKLRTERKKLAQLLTVETEKQRGITV